MSNDKVTVKEEIRQGKKVSVVGREKTLDERVAELEKQVQILTAKLKP